MWERTLVLDSNVKQRFLYKLVRCLLRESNIYILKYILKKPIGHVKYPAK